MKKKQTDDGSLYFRENTQAPLAAALKKYSENDRISFHVPGHKNHRSLLQYGRDAGLDLLSSDLTELPELDDLHNPTGVIREAEHLASKLFGSEQTYFLVNGTTGGMMAAAAAVSSEKDTVIAERNSHECTGRGLILSGAVPFYIYNYFDEKTGLTAGISPAEVEKALNQCYSPAAVILTHPSYYGTYSDLCRIVKIAHQAGVPVIVDEAHGAQLAFCRQKEIPEALQAGADLVVQSTHKMLGSLTQSSMLHVQGNLVDRHRLDYYVSFMNSASPSYLLMSSLDLARSYMERRGRNIWENVIGMVSRTRGQISRIEGIDCPSFFYGEDGLRHELESSRLLISAWDLGLTGIELSRILARDYKIDVEFADIRYAAALAGTGSREEDFLRLTEAVEEIAGRNCFSGNSAAEKLSAQYAEVFSLRPVREMTPRKAAQARTLCLSSLHAEGSVSARDISVYPPGIPVIRAGETITREIISYIEESIKNGFELHGIADAGEDGVRFFCAEDDRVFDMMQGFF